MSYREARKAAGLGLSEAAKKLNVSRVSVWNWESGKGHPRLETLKSAALLYGVTVDELLKGNANGTRKG